MSVSLHAATINVDATCTLIDAINTANTNLIESDCEVGVGPDTIVLPTNHVASYSAGQFSYLSIAGYNYDSALPTITSDITLQGSGTALIERAGTVDEFRILAVEAYAKLTLDSITLRGGKLSGYNSSGAGIYAREAYITINNSAISSNSANWAAGIDLQYSGYFMMSNSTVSDNVSGESGGGVYAFYPASFSITDSSITGNSSGAFGAGIAIVGDDAVASITGGSITYNVANTGSEYGLGGGIYVFDVSLNIGEVRVSDNSAYIGGGIHADDSVIEINKSTLSENTALYGGGGVYLSDSNIEIIQSTISTNLTDAQGGGVLHMGGIGSSFKLSNSTVSGNAAYTGSALYLGAETKELRSSTIYNNSASGLELDAASVLSSAVPTVLVNTIIAGSSNADCYFGVGTPIIVNNSSWFEDSSCDGIGQGKPLLNALADNNEGLPNSTLTHSPSFGSGVLNGGDAGVCALYGAADQRGAQRGALSCDIGAVEGSIAGVFDETCFVVKAANTNVVTFCL